MLIDWFTVAAQAFNFLVLVYLLKRFLYGPITRAMDEREQRIADRLREAEAKCSEAENEAEEYRRKGRELEEGREGKLRQADEEAEERRTELLSRTQAEVEAAREEWIEALQREREVFVGELRKKTGSEVLKVARKALGDLTASPDEELGARLAGVFVQRLESLEEGEKQKCAAAAQGQTVVLRAPFDLKPAHERKVTAAVRSICGDGSEVSWETEPEMGLGVELTVAGLRLSWGVDSYMDALERGVAAVLEQAPTRTKGRKQKQAGAKNAAAGKEADPGAGTDAAAAAGKSPGQAVGDANAEKPAAAAPVGSRAAVDHDPASSTDAAEPDATPDPTGGAAPLAAPRAERKPARAHKPAKKGKPRRKDTA